MNALQSYLDDYLGERVSFDDLRTQWIKCLSGNPGMRVGALRLLYGQSPSERLPDVKILSLKRIVETAYDDDPEDWTVEMGGDDEADSSPLLVQNTVSATRNVIRGVKNSHKPEADSPRGSQRAKVSGVGSSGGVSAVALRPGQVLKDRFVILGQLGTGGTGLVYRARDRLRENARAATDEIALKVLRSDFNRNQTRVDSLQNEALLTQSLSHPNIVRVYDFHQDTETRFLTMELLEGDVLRALIRRSRPARISRDRATRIILGMCRGLAHAHSRGFVHADFKPGNVFLTSADEPKIFDFGLAYFAAPDGRTGATSADADAPALRTNTPVYASCNRLNGGDPVFADDVYSLSCVIYELLAGKHPYQRKLATAARESGLQPERIDGLTDMQWRTLAAGLQLSNSPGTPQVQHLLSAFGDQPLAKQPLLPRKKTRTRSWSPIAIIAAFLGGAGAMLAMSVLGIQLIDARYVDQVRESTLVQDIQSKLGIATDTDNTAVDVRGPDAPGDAGDIPIVAAVETNADVSEPVLVDAQAAPEQPAVVNSAEGQGPSIANVDSTAADTAMVDSPLIDSHMIDSGIADSARVDSGIADSARVDSGIADSAGDDSSEVDSTEVDSTIGAVNEPANVASSTWEVPGFYLGSAVYSIKEGTAALAIEISRQGSVSDPVYVILTTLAGSAQADLDYVAFDDFALRFDVDEVSKTVFIPIVADAIDEGDELFQVFLGTENAESVLAEPSSATVIIIDDDA